MHLCTHTDEFPNTSPCEPQLPMTHIWSPCLALIDLLHIAACRRGEQHRCIVLCMHIHYEQYQCMRSRYIVVCRGATSSTLLVLKHELP